MAKGLSWFWADIFVMCSLQLCSQDWGLCASWRPNAFTGGFGVVLRQTCQFVIKPVMPVIALVLDCFSRPWHWSWLPRWIRRQVASSVCLLVMAGWSTVCSASEAQGWGLDVMHCQTCQPCSHECPLQASYAVDLMMCHGFSADNCWQLDPFFSTVLGKLHENTMKLFPAERKKHPDDQKARTAVCYHECTFGFVKLLKSILGFVWLSTLCSCPARQISTNTTVL